MSEGQRIPLAEASALAEELVALLAPYCQQIQVCGSIRRKAPTVGDLDLIAIPKTATMLDMFSHPGTTIDLLAAQLDELCGQQVIRQARRTDGAIAGWGPRLKKLVFRETKVQVQSVTADTWGMWLVIRTGPWQYSQAFVTPRGQKAALRDRQGNVTSYRAGMLPPGFSFEKDAQHGGFRLHKAHQFLPTPTEESVYDALGMRYVAPEARR